MIVNLPARLPETSAASGQALLNGVAKEIGPHGSRFLTSSYALRRIEVDSRNLLEAWGDLVIGCRGDPYTPRVYPMDLNYEATLLISPTGPALMTVVSPTLSSCSQLP